MLITTSGGFATSWKEEVERQLELLPRKEIAEKSLANSKLIVVKDMEEAIELTNEYAPEHLIVETADYPGGRTCGECGLRFLGIALSGKCGRLCFGNESYFADERICESL